MKLIVDASSLVADSRKRGRELVAHSGLELFVAEKAWSEAQHELARRFTAIAERAGQPASAGAAIQTEAIALVEAFVEIIPEGLYEPFKDEALRRIPVTQTTGPRWPCWCSKRGRRTTAFSAAA